MYSRVSHRGPSPKALCCDQCTDIVRLRTKPNIFMLWAHGEVLAMEVGSGCTPIQYTLVLMNAILYIC